MIINFDIQSSKVTLLQQQNEKKSFVVDFLIEQIDEKNNINFSNVIKNICGDKKLFKILKKEKNTVILPNELVCIDTLTVPYEKRDTRQYLMSKFDLLYGDRKNFSIFDDIFQKNKNVATYLIYITKRQNVFQIVSNFERYGVKIRKISFESSVLLENVLLENRQFTKENLLLVQVNDDNFNFVLSSKGKLFAHQKIYFNSNQFAKKYAKYIKSNYKKLSNATNINEKDIEKTRLISQKTAKNIEFLPVFVKDLQNLYKNPDLNLNFDKVIVVDNNDLFKQDVLADSIKLNIDKNKMLLSAGKNYFIEEKKGLF